jgi:hypothetical protein
MYVHYTVSCALNHDAIANRVLFPPVSLFLPSLSIWCDAIDAGHFTTWPDLTSAQVRRHLSSSTVVHKGHLDQQRTNQYSVQPVPAVVPHDGPTDAHAMQEAHDDTFLLEPPVSRSH